MNPHISKLQLQIKNFCKTTTLCLFFLAVITPLAYITRFLAQDLLPFRWTKKSESYWKKYPIAKEKTTLTQNEEKIQS